MIELRNHGIAAAATLIFLVALLALELAVIAR